MKRFITQYANYKIDRLLESDDENKKEKIDRIVKAATFADIGAISIDEAMKEIAEVK